MNNSKTAVHSLLITVIQYLADLRDFVCVSLMARSLIEHTRPPLTLCAAHSTARTVAHSRWNAFRFARTRWWVQDTKWRESQIIVFAEANAVMHRVRSRKSCACSRCFTLWTSMRESIFRSRLNVVVLLQLTSAYANMFVCSFCNWLMYNFFALMQLLIFWLENTMCMGLCSYGHVHISSLRVRCTSPWGGG